jgi:hypothetical protein
MVLHPSFTASALVKMRSLRGTEKKPIAVILVQKLEVVAYQLRAIGIAIRDELEWAVAFRGRREQREGRTQRRGDRKIIDLS